MLSLGLPSPHPSPSRGRGGCKVEAGRDRYPLGINLETPSPYEGEGWGEVLLDLMIKEAQAQSRSGSDAIAIRVIPNPKHLSPRVWYEEQGFSGSPQDMEVDGYSAIRDGRTVYVNAGNIEGGELYTNIYLISYNQEAQNETRDIFGQMLRNWRFNTNINTPGNCSETTARLCYIDSDCPAEEYCNSDKAEIIRDVKRLAAMYDISLSLEDYQAQSGHYPHLRAGSYLKHQTLSTWPSWHNLLAQEIRMDIPVDPLNFMGDCPGNYHPDTCWDRDTQAFADQNPATPEADLPPGSRVIKYITTDTGAEYTLCAVMESGYVTDLEAGACDGSEERRIEAEAANHNPYIESFGLPQTGSGQFFAGSVLAGDIDGDNLSFSLNTSLSAWTGWSAPPALEPVPGYPNQRNIVADTAGNSGNYQLEITVTDGRGGSVTQSASFDIVDTTGPEFVSLTDHSGTTHDLTGLSNITISDLPIGTALNWVLRAEEAGLEYPLIFRWGGLPAPLPPGRQEVSNQANQHDYSLIEPIITAATGRHTTRVTAVDTGGNSSLQLSIIYDITNNPPAFTSSPVLNAAACQYYEYNLSATDPDGHLVNFEVRGLPEGLSFTATGPNAGRISGSPLSTGSYDISVEARDEYYNVTTDSADASTIQRYTLIITDEAFTVDIPDSTIYVAVPDTTSYLGPTLFDGFVSVTASAIESITLSSPTSPLPRPSLALTPNFWLVTNSSGHIQGTALNNSSDPGTYTVTVNVTNVCGASASDTFNITVNPNLYCGDAIFQPAYGEDCDDGNSDQTDGCTTLCRTPGCGDGFRQPALGEECDDGNISNEDFCTNTCLFNVCGDGYVYTGTEFCDDGNSTDGDGCNTFSANCQNVCGDGSRGGTESCDSGTDNGTPGLCNVFCSGTVNDYCGDNAIQNPNDNGINEICDTWQFGGATCADYGFPGGSLTCVDTCTRIDPSGCCTPVDGGWTGWSPSTCRGDLAFSSLGGTVYYGPDTQTRTCTDPAPACGGAPCPDCEGPGCPNTDTETCCNPLTCAEIATVATWGYCGNYDNGCGGTIGCMDPTDWCGDSHGYCSCRTEMTHVNNLSCRCERDGH